MRVKCVDAGDCNGLTVGAVYDVIRSLCMTYVVENDYGDESVYFSYHFIQLPTIYIAGSITGVFDYRKRFKKVNDFLTKEGHLCMDPSILTEGFPYESYMPICFAMIDACDAIYLLDGWESSMGACKELEYAQSKNKTVFYEKLDKKEGKL